MAETSIEWTAVLGPDGILHPGFTFNPWIGCTALSPACDNCYAEAMVERFGGDFATRRRTSAANWNLPLSWNRKARKLGVRLRVFCASLADVFDNQVPEEWRRDLWALIRATPDLDWLLLTKRPQNIPKMLPPDWGADGYPNVWLGTTVEDQQRANYRVPHLLRIPARVHFLSCEPLLGAVDLTSIDIDGHSEDDVLRPASPQELWEADWSPEARGVSLEEAIESFEDAGFSYPPSSIRLAGIDWVITGGESGHHARHTDVDHVRALRDQCETAGVAFFHKQWGEFLPGNVTYIPRAEPVPHWCTTFQYAERPDQWLAPLHWWTEEGERARATGQSQPIYWRLGKHQTGALLDGRHHTDSPKLRSAA